MIITPFVFLKLLQNESNLVQFVFALKSPHSNRHNLIVFWYSLCFKNKSLISLILILLYLCSFDHWDQWCGIRSLYLPDGTYNEFGMCKLCYITLSYLHCHRRVTFTIRGGMLPQKHKGMSARWCYFLSKSSLTCDMHTINLKLSLNINYEHNYMVYYSPGKKWALHHISIMTLNYPTNKFVAGIFILSNRILVYYSISPWRYQ